MGRPWQARRAAAGPGNAARGTARFGLHAAAARSVKQYFVPGDRSLIASAFDFDAPIQVIAKGSSRQAVGQGLVGTSRVAVGDRVGVQGFCDRHGVSLLPRAR